MTNPPSNSTPEPHLSVWDSVEQRLIKAIDSMREAIADTPDVTRIEVAA